MSSFHNLFWLKEQPTSSSLQNLRNMGDDDVGLVDIWNIKLYVHFKPAIFKLSDGDFPKQAWTILSNALLPILITTKSVVTKW